MFNTLITNKIYLAPALRLSNLVLDYSSDYIDLKVKFNDLGGASVEDEFSQIKSLIPAYSF